jgi:hypothetical protein
MKSGRPTIAAALLAAVMIFTLTAYRDSSRGYFESDDLGTLNWARSTRFFDYVKDVPCLAYPCNHGRPVGFMFYGALYPAAKLSYQWWAWSVLAIGLVNVALLWRLLAELEFDEIARALGCLVFVASRALFDAWTKPMFIYDVLSTTFALIMLLAYARRRWVISFIAMWLAMRTKEIGLVLPAVLLCYEFTLGGRNWKRVLLFAIPPVIYGFYGLLFNLHQPKGAYSMTLAPAALWRSISFYATQTFGLPYAALLLPFAWFVTPDRRIRFALGAALAEIGMYLLLPGRMLDVYLYLSMTSIAILIAALATRYRQTVAILCVIWAAWQFTLIREHAAQDHEQAADRRAYVRALRQLPPAPAYAYLDPPESFGVFGGEYAIRVATIATSVSRFDMNDLPSAAPIPLLTWIKRTRTLDQSLIPSAGAASVDRARPTLAWQGSWPVDDQGYHAVTGLGQLRLYRPRSAVAFEIEACGGANRNLAISIGDQRLPGIHFATPGCLTRTFPVEPARLSLAEVAFNTGSADHTVRVGNFGFK